MEIVAALVIVLVAAAVWMAMAMRERYVSARAWNDGYARGIEQGLAEEREWRGGPPAPIRTEMRVQ